MGKALKNGTLPVAFWKSLDAGEVEMNLRHGERHWALQRIESSPCHQACPAGVDVKGYVGLIADRQFQQAVELVRKDCPLPGICGRVCTHPCELNCLRGDLDEAVSIRLLKRFVSDWELQHPVEDPPKPERRYEENIAIVGAGPAGLAAAFDLANLGYGVTVYESDERPGGMLIQCIPEFRLPRDVIDAEVSFIEKLGVEIRSGVQVGRDISIEELRENHAALILATGTPRGKQLGIPGEREYSGVFDCVTYLKMCNRNQDPPKGKSLLVVGGGMSAMDAARMALRQGFDKVTVVYRRTKTEMPAVPEEVHEAELEGVEFLFLAAPLTVLGKEGKVTGLECQKMELGEPDESGRRRPVPIPDSSFTLEADVIVPAISQEADLSFLPSSEDFKPTSWGTLKTEDTLETGVEKVFAAGDLVMGPDTVIGAIAQGHRAADSAHATLRGLPLETGEQNLPVEIGILPTLPGERGRAAIPMLEVEDRGGMEEVEHGYGEREAVEEAMRCLRCGPCEECQSCADECRHRMVMLASADSDARPLFIRVPENREDFPLSEDPLPVTVTWKTRSKGEKVLREKVMQVLPLRCEVDVKLCRGCGDCLVACKYDSIELILKEGEPLHAKVWADRCKGCGCCVAVCPTQAMVPGYFRHEAVLSEIEQLMASTMEVSS